jgi:hypothetical protein
VERRCHDSGAGPPGPAKLETLNSGCSGKNGSIRSCVDTAENGGESGIVLEPNWGVWHMAWRLFVAGGGELNGDN